MSPASDHGTWDEPLSTCWGIASLVFIKALIPRIKEIGSEGRWNVATVAILRLGGSCWERGFNSVPVG